MSRPRSVLVISLQITYFSLVAKERKYFTQCDRDNKRDEGGEVNC